MTKTTKIIYWVSTCWLALGMASTGVVQLIGIPEEIEKMAHLGYPAYFIKLLGVWKLLGTVAILIPGFTLVKEWAYAGFFFAMTGAIVSHITMGDAVIENFGPTLLLALTILSWYIRPANRKINTTNN